MKLSDLFKPKLEKLETKRDVLGLLNYLCSSQGSQNPDDVYWAVKRLYNKNEYRSEIRSKLLEAMADQRTQVKLMAMRLIFPEPNDWPVFVDLAEDPEPEVRIAAAHCLGYCQKQEADAYLRQLLNDPVDLVRVTAAAKLANHGDDTVQETLLELLDLSNPDLIRHANPVVASQAASALGHFREDRVRDALIKVLENEESTALKALESLGKIGDESSIEALIRALNSHLANNAEPLFGDDNGRAMMRYRMKGTFGNSYVQGKAAEVLAKVGGDRGQFYAYCSIEDLEAAMALERSGDWAKDAVGHPNQEVNKTAAKVLLEKLDSTQVLSFLLELWQTPRDKALEDSRLDDPEEFSKLVRSGSNHLPGSKFPLSNIIRGICLSADLRGVSPLISLYNRVEKEDVSGENKICQTIAENIGMLDCSESTTFLQTRPQTHHFYKP